MKFLLFFLFCCLCLGASELPWIDKLVKPYMKEKKINGISIVYFDGKEAHFLNYGPVSKNTLYDIASITKVFTTLELVLKKMKLSRSIIRYVPELKDSPFMQQVTLKDLATHTSGFPREFVRDNRTKKRIIERLKELKPQQPKGIYVYSNLGFGLLGYALESVGQQSFAKMIEKDILQPLHMNASYVEVRNAWPASGAIRSNTKDMLQFLKLQLGLYGPKELIQAAKTTQKEVIKIGKNLAMGLGFQRYTKNKRLIIDKNGGHPGYSSYIGIIPDKGIGVVILMNKAKVGATQFGRKLLLAV